MQLANATFLITGGASGLGAACARLFVECGANVIIADLNVAAGETLADELGDRQLRGADTASERPGSPRLRPELELNSDSSGSARFAHVDVTSPDDVQAAIDLAIRQFGGLQGVINCAGILHASRVVGKSGPYDLDSFRRVIEINVIGTFNVVRLAAAAMQINRPQHDDADDERGVIINTSSVAAFDGQIGQASYAASKGAVASMTLPIARELAKFGIRCMAIAPGIFDTAMMGAMTDQQRQSLAEQVPFPPRLGRPGEFAALARQIVENPMLNGEVIRLDGALRMGAK